MFGFMDMLGNHEERKVATYQENDLFVDTCRVTDSNQPFETAVSHPAYNDNKLIIVEMYDTAEAAQVGHNKWVEKMLKSPPRTLTDVSTAEVAKLHNALGGLPPFERAEQ